MKKNTKDDLQELKEELYKVLDTEGCTSQKALAISKKLDKVILAYYQHNVAAAS